MPEVESYQSAFRWPRGAYVMHLLVRWILVPSSARLPAIKRPPFSESVIQERKASVDMIRSGCWNPSGAAVQPKKKELVALELVGSMTSLSPEGGSMEVEMLRVEMLRGPRVRNEEGSPSQNV